MLTEALRQVITDTILKSMPEAFIVALTLTQGPQHVLDIKVDTDAGITMDECASISRKVGRALEEREDFDFPYTLQVSSPGIGTPLVIHRQYVKNIGRHLQVRTQEGQTHTGLLRAVDADQITLELVRDRQHKRKKARKADELATEQELQVAFSDIQEAKVVILF